MKLLLENWREFVRLNEAVNPATIEKIEAALKQGGGESYIVGGAVRDELMPDTPPSKDIDFLVRGLSLSDIVAALSPLGKVSQVGRSFGVVAATVDGEEFDFALPRTSETKTGEKHTEFDVETDPNAPVEADLGRRDFTINALAKDAEGNIVDLFGGQEDLKNKIIRAVGDPNERFEEDPLRMLRAIQFAVRFGFTIEPKTLDAIKRNIDGIGSVAGERLFMELAKAWTKGSHNTDILVSLLSETGVGKKIFGEDFDPHAIKAEGDPRDKTISNFIAFFLEGGDYTVMRPAKEVVQYLKLTQQAADNTKPVYEYAGGHRDKLPLVANVLRQIGMSEQADKIEEALQLPLSPSELAVSGADMMQLGLRGKQIGDALMRTLDAIHNRQLDNTYDDIVGFIGQ